MSRTRAAVYAGLGVGLPLLALVAAHAQETRPPPAEAAVKVADGVWFQRHHDVGAVGSNVAWIEFADFVAVVDTAFPAGAERALRSIKATTRGKPIRYAIVTHYHADHSFGSGVFAKEGATVIAHESARRDFLARALRGYAERARRDPAAARHRAHPPDVTFTDRMVIDDGKRRAELYHFGHAHTAGCIFTFLPREKIVFTGDAAVNGNHNYLGDSDLESWIEVLGRVQSLGAETVVPGHGAVGTAEILDNQRRYFVALRDQVAAHARQGRSLEEIRTLVDFPDWKRWTGQTRVNLAHVDEAYRQVTRGPLAFAGEPGQTVAIRMEPNQERPRLKYLTGPLPADQVAGLRQVAPNVELVVARTPQEALAAAPEVHGMSGAFARPEILRAAKNLRWVQQSSAGVEHLVAIPELVGDDRIVLTNMKAMFGPTIADHTFALLLSLVRGLPHYQGLMRTATWGRGQPDGPGLDELKGKTLLVVGLGGIGREVARRGHAFGMHVLATDARELAPPPFVARVEPAARVRALLPSADVVVVAAPLTPQTSGLFDEAAFAAMKPGAYFVNVARGKIQDNHALAAALRAGRLAGAGLDVTDPEPLPPAHPLWKAPNLIITPHVAGQSPGTRARTRALFLENMRRFAAGEPLLNVVDKKAGY